MAEIITIRPADLLIDSDNPRLLQPNSGQREALQSLAASQGRKVLVLAEDILKYGMSPADLMIVMSHPKDNLRRYVVLEGNRRLAALRALENPEVIKGHVEPSVLAAVRKLSKEYEEAPVESLNCVSVKDRKESDHWIELRHTGENKGAGLVPWGSDEASRFKTRGSGKRELYSQALDFLEERGDLSPENRRKVPATTYRRLLGTPEVRANLGIEIQHGEMSLLGTPASVARALLYVASDLSSRHIKVADVYTRPQRLDYARKLPPNILVKHTRKSRAGISVSGVRKKTTRKKARRRRVRDTLIPSDCILQVTEERPSEIEHELRSLKLSDYPNAISVLFRVFVELSADAYVESNALSPENDKLRSKIDAVLKHLRANDKLTRQQATPVRRALQKDSFLTPSVDQMNDYVHNQYAFPASSDLRAFWNGLQPFMMAVWSVR